MPIAPSTTGVHNTLGVDSATTINNVACNVPHGLAQRVSHEVNIDCFGDHDLSSYLAR